VHWGNTGAAWSIFSGNNSLLVVVMLLAFAALFLTRRHFDADRLPGQIAFGLLFGGIAGNLADRLARHQVVDFIRFYAQLRGTGGEIGFPAFNVADTAICSGVGLIFLITWRSDRAPGKEAPAAK
ncbi:MAG: signal peptidase II, partial [Verrucomicrobia bacterium]|nr:signal peptidase II [Verrucomicrobiota bacterium]